MWIEILMEFYNNPNVTVTPYAGVWIEIIDETPVKTVERSLPTRECGLKSTFESVIDKNGNGHSLRGSVD